MYLSIPDTFLVSVCYCEEDILNLKKSIISKESNCDSNFKNKSSNRKDIIIGVSLPTQRDERWVRDKNVIEAYAKEKGVKV